MIKYLYEIIRDRKVNPVPDSYTNTLFNAGRERIAQKVGEEAIEVIIASGGTGKQRLIEETSDLIYHLLVLLVENGVSLGDVEKELEKRHAQKGERKQI